MQALEDGNVPFPDIRWDAHLKKQVFTVSLPFPEIQLTYRVTKKELMTTFAC